MARGLNNLAKLVVGLAGMLACSAALADPISITAALAPYLGGALAAGVATAVTVVSAYGTLALVGYSAFSAVQARRKQRKASAAARAAANAALQDRTAMVLSTESPHQVIYGAPAPIGGSVVAVLSSGAKDEFKHLVIVFADHECSAIDDVLIEGDSLFPLRDGWSTAPGFVDSDDDGSNDQEDETPGSPNPAGARARVSIHLSPGGVDTADPFLMADCPQQWTADHRLSGYTYIVLTLNLKLQRFQGGVPQVTARIRGKKVYDPRTGETAFSRNAALCVADYLRSEAGYRAGIDQIELDSWIAAANACDEQVYASELGAGGQDGANARLAYGPTPERYTCDGAFFTNQDRDATRQQFEDAMAGFTLESGGVWRILAGVWSTPVMSLGDDDMIGPVVVVQGGNTGSNRYNGARGTFIHAEGGGTSKDFTPYVNSVFRNADGKDKLVDLALPWTGYEGRARQIGRIRVEQSRGGFILQITPKMFAWSLQPGDRVIYTCSLYGIFNKAFRVQDWAYSQASPLALIMVEDTPDSYDLVDEIRLDPAPNTALPNPFIAPPAPSSLTARSGPPHMVQQGAGLVARVLVEWDESRRQEVLTGGWVELQWRRFNSLEPFQNLQLPGSATSTYLLGLQETATYEIRVRFVTTLVAGAWAGTVHTVLGLLDDPSVVAGLQLLVGENGIDASWAAPSGLDLIGWSLTELRLGPSWDHATSQVLFSGKATSARLPFFPAGNNLVWAAHANAVGGWSQPVVAALQVELPLQPVVDAAVQGNQVQLRWGDCRTTQPLFPYRIREGVTFEASRPIGTTDVPQFQWVAENAGRHRLWVEAVDRGGNEAAPGTAVVETLASISDAIEENTRGLADSVQLLLAHDAFGAAVGAVGLEVEAIERVEEIADARQKAADDLLDERAARETGIERIEEVVKTGDEQIAKSVETMGATVEANRQSAVAALEEASQTLASADHALGERVTTVAGRVTSTENSLQTQGTAISGLQVDVGGQGTQLRSMSTAIEQLDSRLGTAEGTLLGQAGAVQGLQTSVGQQGQDISSLSSAYTTLNSTVGSNYAEADTRLKALTTEQGSQALSLSGLSSTVGGHTSRLSIFGSTLSTLEGRFNASWSIKTEVGGLISGITLNNDGSTADFVIYNSRFALARDNGTGIRYPFVIGTVGGVDTITFSGNMYGDGSILARALYVDFLSALSAKLGKMTAGTVDLIDDGSGGWGYLRSYPKWLSDGQNGWIFARHATGQSFMEIRAGQCRMAMNSDDNTFILESPGMSLVNGSLTINEIGVVKSLNIAGNAVMIPIGVTLQSGQTFYFNVPERCPVRIDGTYYGGTAGGGGDGNDNLEPTSASVSVNGTGGFDMTGVRRISNFTLVDLGAGLNSITVSGGTVSVIITIMRK